MCREFACSANIKKVRKMHEVKHLHSITIQCVRIICFTLGWDFALSTKADPVHN
ncbi:hypothetical protein RSAG8_01259, partial [Rhizoctonia solani AG-8 WAC10335]